MFGDDRPDEIAPGDELALGFPKLLVFGIPIRDPRRHAHCVVLCPVMLIPVDWSLTRATKNAVPGRTRHCVSPRAAALLLARHWTRDAGCGRRLSVPFNSSFVPTGY